MYDFLIYLCLIFFFWLLRVRKNCQMQMEMQISNENETVTDFWCKMDFKKILPHFLFIRTEIHEIERDSSLK